MRILIALCAAVLLSSAAVGQVVPAYTGYDACGAPYIPRLTTPEVSLQTVSAAPVGARNATVSNRAKRVATGISSSLSASRTWRGS